METWQYIYIGIVFFGFGIGRLVSPILAVALIWTLIVLFEVHSYRRKAREFTEESEEN